ncbi:MAG: Rab family GTPase [Candidatus Thermoplasmatota archaeon]
MQKSFSFKIVLLGNGAVGKTSLVNRYVFRLFSDEYMRTIGVNVKKKNVKIEHKGEKFDINLMIWDIEGQATYNLLTGYLKGAHGGILVCDMTAPRTIDFLDFWLNATLAYSEVGKNIGIGGQPLLIAANKYDLIVDEKKHAKPGYADMINLLETTIREKLIPLEPSLGKINYLFTSAKTGLGVEDIFFQIAKNLIDIYCFKEKKEAKFSEEKYIEKIGAKEENINRVIESLSRVGKKDEEMKKPTEVEALSLITSIPRGLPSPLWGIDMEELAKMVAYGEYRKTSEGDIILKIKNKWYYGDCTDLGIFLQEYRKKVE